MELWGRGTCMSVKYSNNIFFEVFKLLRMAFAVLSGPGVDKEGVEKKMYAELGIRTLSSDTPHGAAQLNT